MGLRASQVPRHCSQCPGAFATLKIVNLHPRCWEKRGPRGGEGAKLGSQDVARGQAQLTSHSGDPAKQNSWFWGSTKITGVPRSPPHPPTKRAGEI